MEIIMALKAPVISIMNIRRFHNGVLTTAVWYVRGGTGGGLVIDGLIGGGCAVVIKLIIADDNFF